MNILGISCFYHDSAACLVQDGEIVAAAQEERFSRKKHDQDFPKQAIDFCLHYAKLQVDDLDIVAFYEKPFLKFERILETYLAYAPRGIASYLMALPQWLRRKLWIPDLISKELGYDGEMIFTEHHESHAASAFFPSPFNEAAIITMDGVGEWTTTSYGIGKDNRVSIIAEIQFPHSLGLLYSAFTYYTGFRVNSGEYKVMGLAPYGEPKYAQVIMDHLIDLKEDGSFRLNMEFFNYCSGLTMTGAKFDDLFGGPPRDSEGSLTQREMDLARSVQDVTEEVMLRIARNVQKETGQRYLVLAGGVALNCVGNGRILREVPFEDLWIQPAAGDAGGALGAALFCWYQYLEKERNVTEESDFQHGSYLGPEFEQDALQAFLEEHNLPFETMPVESGAGKVADLILDQKVIGWFQGRMEFGPRALGARSIVGDARSPTMQKIMNLKIKYRESFRPFAPAVVRERVADFFEIDRDSPYMLLVAPVKQERRRPVTDHDSKLAGVDKVNVVRSDIPAVTHVDYSARIQTVSKDTNPRFHALIAAVNEKSRMSGYYQYFLQCSWRANCLHTGRGLSVLHEHGNGLPGNGRFSA